MASASASGSSTILIDKLQCMSNERMSKNANSVLNMSLQSSFIEYVKKVHIDACVTEDRKSVHHINGPVCFHTDSWITDINTDIAKCGLLNGQKCVESKISTACSIEISRDINNNPGMKTFGDMTSVIDLSITINIRDRTSMSLPSTVNNNKIGSYNDDRTNDEVKRIASVTDVVNEQFYYDILKYKYEYEYADGLSPHLCKLMFNTFINHEVWLSRAMVNRIGMAISLHEVFTTNVFLRHKDDSLKMIPSKNTYGYNTIPISSESIFAKVSLTIDTVMTSPVVGSNNEASVTIHVKGSIISIFGEGSIIDTEELLAIANPVEHVKRVKPFEQAKPNNKLTGNNSINGRFYPSDVDSVKKNYKKLHLAAKRGKLAIEKVSHLDPSMDGYLSKLKRMNKTITRGKEAFDLLVAQGYNKPKLQKDFPYAE